MSNPLIWRIGSRLLDLSGPPLVMGIVNVTPDSFSDGGRYFSASDALHQAKRLIDQGADLIDVGGESSRPGASPVATEEELRRVLPVIQGLAGKSSTVISIDTWKAQVASTCLAAGAQIVNDITGLRGDPDMPEAVRQNRAGAIIMHMQGTPRTMQLAPTYGDVVQEIADFYEERLQRLGDLGIEAERIVLDPGIGFGKSKEHNLEILGRLSEFGRFGRPICLGVSRKGLIGQILKRPVQHRLAGSLGAIAQALYQGSAQIIRVHDVAETRDFVTMVEAIRSRSDPGKI